MGYYTDKTTIGFRYLYDYMVKSKLIIFELDNDIDIASKIKFLDSIFKGYDIGTLVLQRNPKYSNGVTVIDGNKRLSVIYNSFFQKEGNVPFIDMNTDTIVYHDASYKEKYVWPLYLLVSTTEYRNYSKEMLGREKFDDYDIITKEEDKMFDKIDKMYNALWDRLSINVWYLPSSTSDEEINEIKDRIDFKF